MTKEQLWANPSGYSPNMSNSERIAQGAHDKRATWVIHLFFLSELLFPSQKMSDSLKNIWIKSYFCKFKKRSICSSFFLKCNLNYGYIAHQKWVTVSESLTKNEQLWANHSPKMSKLANHSFLERIAHSLFFSQKKLVIHWKNPWANSQPWEPQITCISLKPKIDPPYCTKVYASVLILCTTNPHVLEVLVPSHREIILIIVQTMIYKFEIP